jgi:hypothetical protein
MATQALSLGRVNRLNSTEPRAVLCAVGATDCSSPNVTYNDAGMTETYKAGSTTTTRPGV